jgi:hypothetical protein
MTDCTSPRPYIASHHFELRYHLEGELLSAVQTASRAFQDASGAAEKAQARDRYFRALNAFSSFLLHQDAV